MHGMITTFIKPGILCLVFFSILLIDLGYQSSEAAVRCRGRDRAVTVDRNEFVTGAGTATEFAISNTISATATLNTNLDLNISPDISTLAHGIVTKTTQWVWRVQATRNDNLTGYVTAVYQFNGLVPGDNKICSSPTSCIQVTDITPVATVHRRFGNNNDPNNELRRAQEGITFTMDLSGAKESGTYTGVLQFTLFNGPNPTGVGNVDLTCDRIR